MKLIPQDRLYRNGPSYVVRPGYRAEQFVSDGILSFTVATYGTTAYKALRRMTYKLQNYNLMLQEDQTSEDTQLMQDDFFPEGYEDFSEGSVTNELHETN